MYVCIHTLLVCRRVQSQHCVHVVALSEGIKVRERFPKMLFPKLEKLKLLLKKTF